jgi:hypothetical protein
MDLADVRNRTGDQGAKYRVLSLGLVPVTAPADGDRDGMPDCWEQNQGLNPADSTDAARNSGDGYTWLEKYCHFRADIVLGRQGGGVNPFCGGTVGVEQTNLSVSPARLSVLGNPFRGRLALSLSGNPYQLPSGARMQVCTPDGREVWSQIVRPAQPSLTWEASGHSAGIYLVRLVSNGRVIDQVKAVRLP